MEGQKDYIYEDLPEMCDTSSSLNDENLASSSFSDENHASPSVSIESHASSSMNVQRSSQSNAAVKNVTKTSDKKELCSSCRESVQWTWDNNSKSDYVEIVNDNMDVRFHKRQSNGTAVVRCTEPMSNNQYYWEIKMTYPVYGTDIMIGVGTPEARLKHLQDRFVSLLGMDKQTWGFSYTGLFHHNGRRRCYAQSFGQGNIIGVHLDLWKGTLSFYKDRKHLGVASSGLKGKTLYAMASSTAAHSGMRIIRSCSFPSSLQFLCASKLRELIPDDKNVLDVINVPPGLKQFLEAKLGWLLEKRYLEDDFKMCCTIDDTESDEEEEEEPVVNEPNLLDLSDPFGIARQFILLGSVLLSQNSQSHRAIRDVRSGDREESESEAKRPRCVF